MFKVALVRLVNNQNYDSANESLGIGYLTSALRFIGIPTRIFDGGCFSEQEIINGLREFSPDFVGYSTDHLNIERTIELDKIIQFRKRPFKCYGGAQATFTANDLIIFEDVDAVVLGEGEITLPELVLAVGSGYHICDVKGIVYSENRKPRFTGYREMVSNLDSLELPSRDVLEFKVKNNGENSARIITSRGCFYDCGFCTTPATNRINPGKKYRERNPVKVVDEIEKLHIELGIKYFYFNDDLYFTTSSSTRKRPILIAKELLDRGIEIRYKVEIRSDSVDPSQDVDFMNFLKASGMHRIFVGLESGSNDMLNYLGKQTTNKKNTDFVRFMKSLGIGVNIGRILFGPYTTWGELEESLRGLHKIDSCINVLRRSNMKLMAFPGTRISEQLQKEGLLEPKKSYQNRDYTFLNEKVGLFHEALSSSFPIYFQILKKFFEDKTKGKEKAGLDSLLNDISLNFFLNNIRLGDNWERKAFDEFLKQFLENIKREI